MVNSSGSTLSRRMVCKSAMILPLAAIRGTAANRAVTVGLIGTGNRGPYVAGLMAKHTPARVVALCDIVEEKMERARKTIGVENPKAYSDLHQLLASDVDAVIIQKLRTAYRKGRRGPANARVGHNLASWGRFASPILSASKRSQGRAAAINRAAPQLRQEEAATRLNAFEGKESGAGTL